jgi:hypothetical protein
MNSAPCTTAIAAAVQLFPGGPSMFFATAALLEGGQSTHPLSGSRLEAIADGMRRRLRSFVDRDRATWSAACAPWRRSPRMSRSSAARWTIPRSAPC